MTLQQTDEMVRAACESYELMHPTLASIEQDVRTILAPYNPAITEICRMLSNAEE